MTVILPSKFLARTKVVSSLVSSYFPRQFNPVYRICSSLQPTNVRHASTKSVNNDAKSHNSLETFIDYARKTSLSETSTVYLGTHYEYTVLSSLRRLGFSLSRTGGRLDRGIDLLGTWTLPSLPEGFPLRVLLQCKALKRKPGPNLVRELEGSFAGLPTSQNDQISSPINDDIVFVEDKNELTTTTDSKLVLEQNLLQRHGPTMAFLTTPLAATPGVREALGRSHHPMGFLKVNLDGRVEQMVWNRAAADRAGLLGLGVGLRYLPEKKNNSEAVDQELTIGLESKSLESEIVLTWKGEVWEWKHNNTHEIHVSFEKEVATG